MKVFSVNIINYLLKLLVCLSLIGGIVACTNSDSYIPVEDFFSEAEKSQFKISPDGKHISYLGTHNGCKNVFVIDVERGYKEERLTSEDAIEVTSYQWINNDEIVFRRGGWYVDSLYMYTVHRKSKEMKPLFVPVANVKMRWVGPNRIRDNQILLALDKRRKGIYDVYRVDADKGEKELIATNPGNIIHWYTDQQGKLRMALASDSARETILYRKSESDDFKIVTTNNFKSTIKPIGFCGRHPDKIFALSNVGRDKMALVEYDLSIGKELSLIYDHPDVDLDPNGYQSDKGTMAYASYTTWKKHRHFLDQDIRQLYEIFQQRFKDFEVEIIDRDSSSERFIIHTFTDRNPGAIYYYDIVKGDLVKLVDNNPALKDRNLAEMQSVSFTSRDGVVLQGYLTLPVDAKGSNMPVIVFPHSGPSARNVWSFDPEVQFFANRGYAVFQVNYRGSIGYGKTFWSSGFKEWGRIIQDDLEDGVTFLIQEGIADPERIGIYGFGFGGYAALQAASVKTHRYACAASYSGFINLFTYLREIPPHLQPYLQMYYEIIGDPEKESDLIRSMSPVFYTDDIDIPIFIAQGGRDRWNSVSETNQFVQKLRKRKVPVTYLLQEDEGRYFAAEKDRFMFYHQLGDFFDEHLK